MPRSLTIFPANASTLASSIPAAAASCPASSVETSPWVVMVLIVFLSS
jgi:hypothetical protein